MEIIIKNPEKVKSIKGNIKNDGADNLHILSDFDRTLTYGVINGVKTPSIISMLRDGNHLSEYYAKKASEFYKFYSPQEKYEGFSLTQRKEVMTEWWETHNKLLIEEGLSLADLKDIVENGHVRFRESVDSFLTILEKNNVPLLILSAAGCGDAIPMYFKKFGKEYLNIFYLTNLFNWDDTGKAISTKGEVIHTLNKDETIVKNFPEINEKVEARKNVILLGDGLGDLEMITGFEYDNLLTIGFLNSDYNQNQDEYEEQFDIVLKGDGDFDYVNKLIKELV